MGNYCYAPIEFKNYTKVRDDKIEKDFEGCVIRQHWRQMNDRFALPGAPWRYAGGSVTAIASDGRWQQNWLDNGGGNLGIYIQISRGPNPRRHHAFPEATESSDWISSKYRSALAPSPHEPSARSRALYKCGVRVGDASNASIAPVASPAMPHPSTSAACVKAFGGTPVARRRAPRS